MSLTTDGHVFAVDVAPDGASVQAWSTTRLPYEPKGAMEHFRASLRAGIKQLVPTQDGVLHALYGSPVREDCDAENVAVYNVGSGSFTTVSRRGLRIERGLACPPPNVALADEPRHYLRYRPVEADDPLAVWELGDALASWRDLPVPRLNEETKPSTVWAAMRTGKVEADQRAGTGEPFGLVLRVGVPPGARAAPAKLVKPLADGVIAALHVYSGGALAAIAPRVQAQMPSLPVRQIAQLLSENSAGVLGSRNFVWPRGAGLQWSPADHLCWALVVDVEPAERWLVSGEATTLAARNAEGAS